MASEFNTEQGMMETSLEASERVIEGQERDIARALEVNRKLRATKLELLLTLDETRRKTGNERRNRLNLLDRIKRLNVPCEGIRNMAAATNQLLDKANEDLDLYRSVHQENVHGLAAKSSNLEEFSKRIGTLAISVKESEIFIKEVRAKDLEKVCQEVYDMTEEKARLAAEVQAQSDRNKKLAADNKAQQESVMALKLQTQQKEVLIAKMEADMKKTREEDEARTFMEAQNMRHEWQRELEEKSRAIGDVKAKHQTIKERKMTLKMQFDKEKLVLQELAEVKKTLVLEQKRNNEFLGKKAQRDKRCEELRSKITAKQQHIAEIRRNNEMTRQLVDDSCEKIEALESELAGVLVEIETRDQEMRQDRAKHDEALQAIEKKREDLKDLAMKELALAERAVEKKVENNKRVVELDKIMKGLERKREEFRVELVAKNQQIDNIEREIREMDYKTEITLASLTEDEKLLTLRREALKEKEINHRTLVDELRQHESELQDQLHELDSDMSEKQYEAEQVRRLIAQKKTAWLTMEEMQKVRNLRLAEQDEKSAQVAALGASVRNTEAVLLAERARFQKVWEEKQKLSNVAHDHQCNAAYITYLKQEQETESYNNVCEEASLREEIEKVKADYEAKIEMAKQQLESMEDSLPAVDNAEHSEEMPSSPVPGADPDPFVSGDDDSQQQHKVSQKELSQGAMNYPQAFSQQYDQLSQEGRYSLKSSQVTVTSKEEMAEANAPYERLSQNGGPTRKSSQLTAAAFKDDLPELNVKYERLSQNDSMNQPQPLSQQSGRLSQNGRHTLKFPQSVVSIVEDAGISNSLQQQTTRSQDGRLLVSSQMVTVKTEKNSQEDQQSGRTMKISQEDQSSGTTVKRFFKSRTSADTTGGFNKRTKPNWGGPMAAIFGHTAAAPKSKRLPFRDQPSQSVKKEVDREATYDFDSNDSVEIIEEKKTAGKTNAASRKAAPARKQNSRRLK